MDAKDKLLDAFDTLFEKVFKIANDDELSNNDLIELMKSYDNESTDIGTLRTLLMSIKPLLKNNEELKCHYNKLSDRLRELSASKKI
ncbi:hypothetical protein [Elizabethkingia anophelis]|uniref:hypothetical protein n=1 Tax=Elizabethkingia anophelis TaxID=1117645 RepID=UPI0007508EA6|nr:hypothetical protein [Elizabethkingia anophelis]AQW91306.1 hypothetical protein BBD28_11860 [Elizabethkingia anophelis]KUY14172.1 hypothetical protein ATB94_09240 [Elizabethkingia anophelis]